MGRRRGPSPWREPTCSATPWSGSWPTAFRAFGPVRPARHRRQGRNARSHALMLSFGSNFCRDVIATRSRHPTLDDAHHNGLVEGRMRETIDTLADLHGAPADPAKLFARPVEPTIGD